jgi:hypothetical protein
VLWDGFVNSEKLDENGYLKPGYAICVDNGDIGVLNADLANDSENITTDTTQHACRHEKLPPVSLKTI